jgi:hypothetical protein
MKRHSFAASLALGLLSILAIAGPLAATEATPFRGSYEGSFTVTSATPPFIDAFLEGAGHATHLGRFTVTEPHHVNLETATGTGTFTFVAANGDTMTADVNAEAFPTDDPDVLLIVEHATITGGTGRFAGATGSFTVERVQDIPTSTTSSSFEGTIVLAKH